MVDSPSKGDFAREIARKDYLDFSVSIKCLYRSINVSKFGKRLIIANCKEKRVKTLPKKNVQRLLT